MYGGSDTTGRPTAIDYSVAVRIVWLARSLQLASSTPEDPVHIDPDTHLRQRGAEALADAELLSFLLTRGGAPGEQALRTAERALVAAGGLAGLARQGEGELQRVSGIGPARARRLLAVATLARRIADRPLLRGELLTSPSRVYEAVRGSLGAARRESFVVLMLDARCRLLGQLEVARGRGNQVAVTPREVFEPAVRECADSVVLVHNHPSGDPTASVDDLRLTDRLVAAGELLGISVRDHVIVAEGAWLSLAEQGQLGGL